MRPRFYNTADEISKGIDEYFEAVTEDNPPTITGLAHHLGFESRQSFYAYEKNGEFSYTLKRARLKIEREYEKRLHGTSPTGAIFALKNFGWDDKQTSVLEGGLNIKIERVIVEPNSNTDS